MYTTTSMSPNNTLFSIVSPDDSRLLKSNKYLLTIKKPDTHLLFNFKQPVFVTADQGKALLVLATDPDNSKCFEFYILDKSIQIPNHVYFNTLALTPETSIYLQSQDGDNPQTVNLLKKVSAPTYRQKFEMKEIFSISTHLLYNNERINHLEQTYYEWLICLKGTLNCHYQGKITEISTKSSLLIGPHHACQLSHATGDQVEYLSICFDAQGMPQGPGLQNFELGHLDWQNVKDLINIVENSGNNRQKFDIEKIYTILTMILLSYFREEKPVQSEPVSSMRSNYESNLFQDMVQFLKENIEERNEVNDLVDKYQLSRSTIQNLFLKHANTTPKSYINQIRLNRSKELMKHTSLTISEIADKLGYGSLPYFSRAFSQEFGLSPSAYAKSMIK